MIDALKQDIINQTSRVLRDLYGDIQIPDLTLEPAPRVELGDLSMGMFPLAKVLRRPPAKIAAEVAGNLNLAFLQKVEAVGPYLNFRFQTGTLFRSLIDAVLNSDHPYGFTRTHAGRRALVEFSSPNTNKPLHIGHVRNIVLGWSICRLLEAVGYDVTRACLVNDRGIHICKSMTAYRRFFEGQTPDSRGQKGDHFVGDCYVAYGKALEEEKRALAARFEREGVSPSELNTRVSEASELERETREMLRLWEAGDTEVRALWNKMNAWVYAGFDETYERLGVHFDKVYYESEIYQEGREIVLAALRDGKVMQDEDGSVFIDLSDTGLGRKILLRSDGTTLYITQDIGLAVRKWEDYHPHRSIYVIGNEQNHQMKVLFATLKALGYTWADGLEHFSYGMVFLPDGIIKTREGNVVDADDLMDEMFAKARDKALEAFADDPEDPGETVDQAELARRARIVGLGAIKHYMLKYNPKKEFTFFPDESIQLTGDTGPYVQYTHARIQSILRKAAAQGLTADQAEQEGGYDTLGNSEEREVARLLLAFPGIVEGAARSLSPSTVTRYLNDLASAYNRFYHDHSVLRADTRALQTGRLALSAATATVLARGLDLLGIEAPDVM